MNLNDAPTLIFGLKPYEVLTLFGVVFGPLIAVGFTLWVERRRATYERRLAVFKVLLATYRLVSDANWSIAMNLLLVEFSKDNAIMQARKDYMALVRQRVQAEHQAQHFDEIILKQTALVFQVARALKFAITEGELRSEAYIAEGMIVRDNLLLDSQKALRDIATALQQQLELVKGTEKA